MSHRVLSLILPCILILIFSCAHHQPVQVPQLALDLQAQQNKVEKDGVVLMAKPIHRKSELKAYFDDDLLDIGVLPIQISVINKTNSRTLVLSPAGINLIDAGGGTVPHLEGQALHEKVKKSYWRSAGWTAAFGIFGLIPSLINVGNANERIQAYYDARAIKGGNLVPGAMVEGLCFYSVPPELSSLHGWKISIALINPVTSDHIFIEYGLQGTIIPRPNKEAPSAAQTKPGDEYSPRF